MNYLAMLLRGLVACAVLLGVLALLLMLVGAIIEKRKKKP